MPELEPYTKAHIPLAAHRVLAGLRAGCLPLQVELGRFTCPKTPLNSDSVRCVGEAPEDQMHFLLIYALNLGNPEWHFLSQCQKSIKTLSPNQFQRNCLSSSTRRNTYIVSPWVFIICIHVGKNWFITSHYSIFLHAYTYFYPLFHIPPLHSKTSLLLHLYPLHYLVTVITYLTFDPLYIGSL